MRMATVFIVSQEAADCDSVEELVASLDWTPTLLEAAGGPRATTMSACRTMGPLPRLESRPKLRAILGRLFSSASLTLLTQPSLATLRSQNEA